MKRIAVIGDPHFREGCVREMEIFIEETLRILEENRELMDTIVVLGDVMDRHGILHQKPFHQSCRFLIELSKIRPTFCLIGNHDFDVPSKYLPENHPFKVMTWTKIPNLTIVEKPMVVDDMLMTPYVPSGMFARAIRQGLGLEESNEVDVWTEMTNRGIRLVFAHQEFRGCQMGRVRSEHGDPWPDVPFGQSPFVVSGHIHDYQILGENILYVGTPVQVNYGEGVKRGICLLEVDHPTGYDVRWFKIRVPRKLSKTVTLDNLDSWVAARFHELCLRYTLDPDALGGGRKRKTENFETIQRLLGDKDYLGPLRDKLSSDRYADQVRLQVKVIGKISGVVVRNVIMRIKDLPLGVQQVFVDEEPLGKYSDSSSSSETGPDTKRGWVEMMSARVSSSEGKKDLLAELLYGLTQKV